MVDGCYSWYVGAANRLVSEYRGVLDLNWIHIKIEPLWNRDGLLEYCFKMEQCGDGGLRDKPDMRSDLYHTMYCLCGLSTYGGVLSVVTLLMIKCRMILIAFIAYRKWSA